MMTQYDPRIIPNFDLNTPRLDGPVKSTIPRARFVAESRGPGTRCSSVPSSQV
jgi:hypothetical protein